MTEREYWEKVANRNAGRQEQERTATNQRVEADKQIRQEYQKRKFYEGPSLKKKALGTGFALGAGVDTILNMKSGDDFGTAAVKGAFTGMLYTAMPQIMIAKDIAGAAANGYAGYYNWKRQQGQWWNQQFLPNFGGAYQDTRRAQTMRQAAVEAIQGSKMNARSALGGEARLISQNFSRG